MFIRSEDEILAELKEVDSTRRELRNELKRVKEYKNYFYFIDKAAIIMQELITSKWEDARSPHASQSSGVVIRARGDYKNSKTCDICFKLPRWTSPGYEVLISAHVGREQGEENQWWGNYSIDVGMRSKNSNKKLIDIKADNEEQAIELMLAEIEKAMIKIKTRFQKKLTSN